MTHPAAISLALRDAGMTMRLAPDGRLLINPIASLAGELREQVIARRAELVAWLAAAADDEARADALAAEAWRDDPFAGGGGGPPVMLCEYDLIRVSGDGQPPAYVATRRREPR